MKNLALLIAGILVVAGLARPIVGPIAPVNIPTLQKKAATLPSAEPRPSKSAQRELDVELAEAEEQRLIREGEAINRWELRLRLRELRVYRNAPDKGDNIGVPEGEKSIGGNQGSKSKDLNSGVQEVEQSFRDNSLQANVPPANKESLPQSEFTKAPTLEPEDSSEVRLPIEKRSPSESTSERVQFVVNVQRINVRAAASANAAKLGELSSGEIVDFDGKENAGWAWISARNGTLEGWVKKTYLVLLESQGLY